MKPYMCGDEPAVYVPSGGCECNYRIKKVDDPDYAAVYVLTNDGVDVEVPIRIPKDQYVVNVTENEVECEEIHTTILDEDSISIATDGHQDYTYETTPIPSGDVYITVENAVFTSGQTTVDLGNQTLESDTDADSWSIMGEDDDIGVWGITFLPATPDSSSIRIEFTNENLTGTLAMDSCKIEVVYNAQPVAPYVGAQCADHYIDIEMSDGSHFYTVLPNKEVSVVAGSNVWIDEEQRGNKTIYTVNATGGEGGSYVPGSNIQINGNVISATDTTYTAGTNISISPENVISSSNTTYTAGTNVSISSGNVISATDTKYTAGSNVSISGTTISATNNKTTVAKGSSPTTDVTTVRKGSGALVSSSTSGATTAYKVTAPWFVVEKQISYTISANSYKSINWLFLAESGYTKVGIVECTTGSPHAYFATIGLNSSVIKSTVAGTFTAVAYCLYLKN